MKIELLHVAGCPHVADARHVLLACLVEFGISETIEEREGAFPSPTILVDGDDVMGEPASKDASCRLDVPTRERIAAAIQRHRHA